DPATIVSKMFAHYQHWKSAAGTIVLTTTAGQESGRLVTTVAAKDPSFLLIRQVPEGIQTNQIWSVVSDGQVFQYPVPAAQLSGGTGKMIQEKVNQDGVLLSSQDIYGVVAPSLKDRSAPLSILFGRTPDLMTFKGQLASLTYQGQVTVNGQACD